MDHRMIQDIFNDSFGKNPTKIKRMPTGLGHYVYRVDLEDGDQYTIRLSKPENAHLLKGSLYWLEKLKPLNIPIPKLLVDGSDHEVPYVILNFLPGQDLGPVYHELTETQKKDIIKEIISIQNKVETLPQGQGYGYLTSYEDTNYASSWKEILQECLEDAKNNIRANGIFNPSLVAPVEKLISNFDDYFKSIEPAPFLDDISNKNVLIHKGKLSGIIDLDWLCFGDKLLVVGLTNMALLAQRGDTNYITYWKEGLDLNETQDKIVDLYTLIFCLIFMGEKGMKFNKEEPLAVSQDEIQFLNQTYRRLIDTI